MPTTLKGVALAVAAGCCWGSMAVFAQYLFTYCRFSAEDLTALRIIGAGLLLLLIAKVFQKQDLFGFFKNKKLVAQVCIYAVGVLLTQYTFFVAIHASNASTAALMVGFGPLFIIFYYVLFHRRKPRWIELFCLALALTGVFLLVTKGNFTSLDFSAKGVCWGLASAACGAFCTLQPRPLIKEIGVSLTVGWGMFIGGVLACLFTDPFTMDVDWTWKAVGCYFFIIAFGTVAAFWCYLKSTEFILPSITAILGSFEPFTAFVLSVVLLGMSLNGYEILGAVAIIANMIILALSDVKEQS